MNKRDNRTPPALKHGIYSGMALLPGEDAAEFRKLEKEVMEEFEPVGPLEKDICTTIARLLWRKRNLGSYRLAEEVKARLVAAGRVAGPPLSMLLCNDTEEAQATRLAEARASHEAEDIRVRRELGPAEKLIDIGEIPTIEYLESELDLMDRLDGLIDRCVKRLLMVRGLKSLSQATGAPGGPRRIA